MNCKHCGEAVSLIDHLVLTKQGYFHPRCYYKFLQDAEEKTSRSTKEDRTAKED